MDFNQFVLALRARRKAFFVALDGRAALIVGPSGAGKSDLAVRCILQGAWIDGRHVLASLIADDQVIVDRSGGGLVTRAPEATEGRIEVRGLGLMAAVEVVQDRDSRTPYPAAMGIGGKLARAMRDRGVVTRVKGESILFAPPLVVSEAQVDTIVNATAEAIDAVTGAAEGR